MAKSLLPETADRTKESEQSPAVAAGLLPLSARYQSIAEIARGGMGMVLHVHDVEIDRPLAVKLMLECAPNSFQRERFLAEARITGQLQHPGIPPVHEIGALADGRPFFSMKLIKGRSLAELLKERSSPQTDLPQFLKIFEQIAQTVGYAHAQGIIHRDLKPSNIMVGAFGEVQVMDWGLAKRLADFSLPMPLPAQSVLKQPTVNYPMPEPTTDTVDWTPNTPAALTQAGQVMGTFAYMPPEQACGKVDQTNEGSDVFGLGAILCEILTGLPPYAAKDRQEVFRQAREGDLAAALARLDNCGADDDLIALTKSYLSPQPNDRPRHAGEVAAQITAYLNSVQERLRQAELERTAAEVKVQEEKKKRRWQMALAGALVLLLAGGSTAGLWYQQERAQFTFRQVQLEQNMAAAFAEAEDERQQIYMKLADPILACELISNINGWKNKINNARRGWERAKNLADANPDVLTAELAQRLEQVDRQIQADENHWDIAKELDKIREEASTLVEGKFDPKVADPKYKEFFSTRLNLDWEQQTPAQLAEKVRQSKLRYVLVATLDFWVTIANDKQHRARLMETARLADPNPWRDRARDPRNWPHPKMLLQLAQEADFSQQSPQVLHSLIIKLPRKSDEKAALLRRALFHYPQDFWLHLEMGWAAQQPSEQLGSYQAALALRRDSGVAHNNLGAALRATKDLDGAIRHWRKALDLNPNYATAHNNLGIALHDKKDLDGAIHHYRKALDLDPSYAKAHYNLGNALYHTRNLDEAIQHYHKALNLDPNHALAHCNLGIALRDQGNFAKALHTLQRGHALGSKQPGWSYPSAQSIQYCRQLLDLDQRLAAVLQGQSQPRDAVEQLALAVLCRKYKKHYVTATRFYSEAFQTLPEWIATNRYDAACAALLAAAGQGRDAGQLDEQEKAELRRQALGWLQDHLAALDKQLPNNSRLVQKTLAQWHNHPDLASIRDNKALASLPEQERQAWQVLWQQARQLQQQAQKQK